MAWLIYLACASFDKFMEPLKLYFIIYVSDCPERVFCIKRIVLNVYLVNEILSKGFCLQLEAKPQKQDIRKFAHSEVKDFVSVASSFGVAFIGGPNNMREK